MKIFAVCYKAKPDIENKKGLNLAVFATVQVTKLPLQHEIRRIGMICFAKPGLTTEDLYIVHKK
jgi:hypothetical protein